MELSPIGAMEETSEPELEPQPWTGARLALAAVGAALAAAALAFLSFAACVGYIRFPFSDPHNWIAGAFGAEKTGDWLGYLWTPHVDQRIPTALLVTAVDLRTLQHWPSFLLAGALLWIAGCAGLALVLARARIGLGLKLAAAALAAVLAFNIGLAEDFALPVFSVYLFVAGPALAAFALFPMSEAKGLRSPLFWLTILLAGLASCGNAAGLAVWPALIVAALMQRRSGAEMLVLATLAIACCGGFEIGLGVPSHSVGTGGDGASHLWKMVVYFAGFGALPWSRAIHPALLETLVGLVAWGAAAWGFAGVQPGRTGGSRALATAGAGLILFGFLAAAMATVGRVDELPEPLVPTRYTPFATVLQIGVVLTLVHRLERSSRLKIAVAVAFVLAALILATAPHGAQAFGRSSARIAAASEAFDRTGRQGALQMNPDPALAASVRAELRHRGLAY